MAWKRVPNLMGKIYIPDMKDDFKKHPCRDCFSCQNCSDDRCAVCKAQKAPGAKTVNAHRPAGAKP